MTQTMARLTEDEPLQTLDEEALPAAGRPVGRPSKAEPFRQLVADATARDPSIPSADLLAEARRAGYQGGKSAFYALVARVRPSTRRNLLALEALPGEWSQHEFGWVRARTHSGELLDLPILITRLRYSRWLEASILPDTRVESILRAFLRHLASIEGVPMVAAFSRPDRVTTRFDLPDGRVEWHPMLANLALDLGIGLELCRPERGRKAPGEALQRWIESSAFAEPVANVDEARQVLHEWLVVANTKRPAPATGVVPVARMEDERNRLRPLRLDPEGLVLRMPINIGPRGRVSYEGTVWTVPSALAGSAATLHVASDALRLVTSSCELVHPRRAAQEMATELAPLSGDDL
jgi:hypothetical protein